MQRHSGFGGLDVDVLTGLLPAACRRDPAGLTEAASAILADERGLEYFTVLASRHGVRGLALSALQRAGGLDKLSPHVAERARENLRALRRRATILGLERDRMLAILRRRDLDVVVLKGAGLASTVYRDPVERDFGDVDVLLPPAQIDAAVEALGQHGYAFPGPTGAAAAYRQHHFHLRMQRGGGLVIELHWDLTLALELFRLDPAAFLAESVTAGATGVEFRVPRPEHALLHVVLENVRDAFSRLTRLVDVDRIVASAPELDWDHLHAAARTGGLGPALALCLELSRGALGTEIPMEVQRRMRPTRAVRFHLALLRPASSLLSQRAIARPSWGELIQLWLVTGRSRGMTLLQMLRADSGEPLQWLWDGGDSDTAAPASLASRLSRVAKVVGYQLGLYASGLAGLAGEARSKLW
ncbi:MAG: nucleotidyltransferase family protein [Gemmatimonadota bacterium]|nr:nucleotidyltransferase family protein [Gemmatimonadota bacterium]